jgi:hypothetical protein
MFTSKNPELLRAMKAEDLDSYEQQVRDAYAQERQGISPETASSEQIESLGTVVDELETIGLIRKMKPIAASARPASISQIRVPKGHEPAARSVVASATTIVRSTRGAELRTAADIGRELAESFRLQRGSRANGRFLFARIESELPEPRRLGADPQLNAQRIKAVTGPEALTASGGLCAPTEALYAVYGISVADRPVRDSLAVFNAERGGIRFAKPPTISDVQSGTSVWSTENDANPSDPSTKPCVKVDCGQEQEVTVDAVTRCLEMGNFTERAWPEQLAAQIEVILSAHARTAEGNLLDYIGAGSTDVTDGQIALGAARDVVESYIRAAAQYRSRNRMRRDATIQVLAPSWLYDLMVADLVLQSPGDNAFANATAMIAASFRAANLAVTWYLDTASGEGQVYSSQGAGPLLGWELNPVSYVFSPGSWLFLDGGVLDLGIIRDSTLNSTNDLQVFGESFEAAALVGVESLKLTNELCITGASSAPIELTCLTPGS